jgi:hypothetical protein
MLRRRWPIFVSSWREWLTAAVASVLIAKFVYTLGKPGTNFAI